jgi:hypothetical protein
MDFCYLTETKNEFNNFMANILIPNIYNDIYMMLEKSMELLEKLKREKKDQGKAVTDIFIMMLKSKAELNAYEIESEYNRIKASSGCSDWFDNLIRASFKSYTLFLTWNNETKSSKFADNKFIAEISIKDFVHRTFIESCNYFITNPEIIMKKTLKREIYGIINVCIENAIRFMLPYNEMLQEYLLIDFNGQSGFAKELAKIKQMVEETMHGKGLYGYKGYSGVPMMVSNDMQQDGGMRASEEVSGGAVEGDVDDFIDQNKTDDKPLVIQNSSEPTVYVEENITLGSSNELKPIENESVEQISMKNSDNALKPVVGKVVDDVTQPRVGDGLVNSSEPITMAEMKVREVEQIMNGGKGASVVPNIVTKPKVVGGNGRKINVVRSNKTTRGEAMDAFFSGIVK